MAGQRLGQHFLSPGRFPSIIAEAACPAPEPLVVEIGPGGGVLTEELLRRAARVVAIELDAALAERLRSKYAGDPRLTVVTGDVLATDLTQWGPAVVAGNLPYYITSPILEKVLALGPLLKRGVFLLQKEVAGRLVAAPGSREYGYLTVRTRLYALPRILARVPRSAFRPPPNVDSVAVVLDPHPPAEPGPGDPEDFLRFVGLCFRQKRKTVRNNLLAAYPKQLLEAFPETSKRAEQLSLEALADLYRRIGTRDT